MATQYRQKNATLDVLFRFRENPEHIQITADFLGLWENKSSVLHMSTLDMLLAIKDPEDFSSWPSGMVEERQKIDRFLNRYKMISIGINVHALHEHLFKRCWRSIFVRHYIRSLRYIYYQQRINPVIFIAYSVLAEKWMTSQESEECRFLKQDLEKEISVYENKHGINFRDRYR